MVFDVGDSSLKLSFLEFFFFWISIGNFIQELNNESTKYIGSIQQGTNIIKCINYRRPSKHRPKKWNDFL